MALRRVGNGVYLDPETGELSGSNRSVVASQRVQDRYTQSNNRFRGGNSLWDRFDNFIIGIGNWIARNGERVRNFVGLAMYGLVWLGFAIGVITTWAESGFILALIFGVICGGILYVIANIALGIFTFVTSFMLLIIRYIFYSGITFVVTLAVVLAVAVPWNGLIGQNSYNKPLPAVERVCEEPPTTTYCCTARSGLNVRFSPNANSRVIGLLPLGQNVEVYEMSINGFAKIEYNGGVAYASAQYLKQY